MHNVKRLHTIAGMLTKQRGWYYEEIFGGRSNIKMCYKYRDDGGQIVL